MIFVNYVQYVNEKGSIAILVEAMSHVGLSFLV